MGLDQPARGSDVNYCSVNPPDGHCYASTILEHTLTHRHGVWYRVCLLCEYVDLSEVAGLVNRLEGEIARLRHERGGLQRRLDTGRQALDTLDQERTALADRLLMFERKASVSGLWFDVLRVHRRVLGISVDEWVIRELTSIRTHRDALRDRNQRLTRTLGVRCSCGIAPGSPIDAHDHECPARAAYEGQ